jgi:hypothetical protein
MDANMIGGCIISGKYNMTAQLWSKGTETNANTGQVKAVYTYVKDIDLIARGLANLRGKDSGTIQEYRNKLQDYHFLRVKTMENMDEGDILAQITDSDGLLYAGDPEKQFVVLGVTPTFDPFGKFTEYDILCDEAETYVKLCDEAMAGSDSMMVSGSGGSA